MHDYSHCEKQKNSNNDLPSQQRFSSNYINMKELFETFEPQIDDFESMSESKSKENESCELAYEPWTGVRFILVLNYS